MVISHCGEGKCAISLVEFPCHRLILGLYLTTLLEFSGATFGEPFLGQNSDCFPSSRVIRSIIQGGIDPLNVIL